MLLFQEVIKNWQCGYDTRKVNIAARTLIYDIIFVSRAMCTLSLRHTFKLSPKFGISYVFKSERA